MIRIREPFHGAVLNHRHGEQTGFGLRIVVRGDATMDESVSVNGAPARQEGDRFTSEVLLTDGETDIAAVGEGPGGRDEHRIRVVWDRYSVPRYRFSIDDNIFFLRDLAATKPRSIFDNFYLAFLHEMNRKYGTKFTVNLFFSTPEKDFDLSQMPDTWRAEFSDNAAWMGLTFHARNEFPDRPYQHATEEELGKDFDDVATEIRRFAGERAWVAPTVIHWGMVHPAAMPALVRRGVKVLSGMFAPDTGSRYQAEDENASAARAFRHDINYWLDSARSDYLRRHDALKDFATGIVYSAADIVCNNCPVEKTAPTLEAAVRNPDTAEILELFTHEQYFWPFYFNYRPDHRARCEAAIRFCAERGYAPVFFHEGLLGGREWAAVRSALP